MSNVLNFNKWRKLYESEMAVEVGGSNNYSKYKGNAQATLSALKAILAKRDAAGFWNLSNAVGGILKTIGGLDLSSTERAVIASDVRMVLDKSKYGATIEMFAKWADSTTWESFTSLFKDDSGRGEGLTDDFKNKF